MQHLILIQCNRIAIKTKETSLLLYYITKTKKESFQYISYHMCRWNTKGHFRVDEYMTCVDKKYGIIKKDMTCIRKGYDPMCEVGLDRRVAVEMAC